MKILVTGATGFIGHYVIEELLRHNCFVIASSVDRQKAARITWFDKVTYISFNLADFDPVRNYYSFFNEPDLVIHLAWEGLPNYKSHFHEEVNLPRHFAFLKNLIENGLNNLTVTGTCFEYGMQEGSLNEDMSTFPVNSYGRAKDALRKELEHLQSKHSFIFKWIRLFYMYGKGQNPNSLFSMLDKALANGDEVFNMSAGEQVRDYLPVEKMAEYIVKIALQNKVTGIINCCSGEPVTVKQMVENYLKEKHKNVYLNLGYYPYSDYEPMRFWGDDAKLKTILNNEVPLNR